MRTASGTAITTSSAICSAGGCTRGRRARAGARTACSRLVRGARRSRSPRSSYACAAGTPTVRLASSSDRLARRLRERPQQDGGRGWLRELRRRQARSALPGRCRARRHACMRCGGDGRMPSAGSLAARAVTGRSGARAPARGPARGNVPGRRRDDALRRRSAMAGPPRRRPWRADWHSSCYAAAHMCSGDNERADALLAERRRVRERCGASAAEVVAASERLLISRAPDEHARVDAEPPHVRALLATGARRSAPCAIELAASARARLRRGAGRRRACSSTARAA